MEQRVKPLYDGAWIICRSRETVPWQDREDESYINFYHIWTRNPRFYSIEKMRVPKELPEALIVVSQLTSVHVSARLNPEKEGSQPRPRTNERA